MRLITEIVRDIRHGENLDNYVLLAIAAIAALLSYLGILSQSTISSITLAVLASIIFVHIKTASIIQGIKEGPLSSLRAFYENRSKAPSLQELLTNAKHKIIITGLQLGDIIHNRLPFLCKCAERGCRIKLLLLTPVDSMGIPLPWLEDYGRVDTFEGLSDLLSTNLKQLAQWKGNLTWSLQNRIEIRCYDSPPTCSIVYIDKDKPTGTIKCEPIIHGIHPSQRPSMLLD